MILIPLEVPFIIWLAATVASGMAGVLACRRGNKPMGFGFAGFALGAASMVLWYGFLLYVPFRSYEISIMFSRWAISVNGLMILGGSISALIINAKGKRNGNDT